MYLRDDSGFATPELYELAEHNGCSYAIRLKTNPNLYKLAEYIANDLDDVTKNNKVDYAVYYGEFMYKAVGRKYPRRVGCKVEKPYNQFTYTFTFIVTNMDLDHYQLIQFYCNRGRMGNFIKESKLGFNFELMSSNSMIKTLYWFFKQLLFIMYIHINKKMEDFKCITLEK